MPTTIQFKPLSKYRILLSSRSFHYVSLCARKSLNQFTKTSYVYFSVLFSDVKLVVEIGRGDSGNSYTMETGRYFKLNQNSLLPFLFCPEELKPIMFDFFLHQKLALPVLKFHKINCLVCMLSIR